MTTTIKITELTDIGANLASSTVLPVVNMSGTPTTQKTVLGNIANVILEGAGTDYSPVGEATLAGTVTTNAQPNITSTGSLTGLTVSNSSGVVNFSNTANVTLGAVGNLHISGGTAGQLLSTNGNGTLSWASDTTTYGNSNVAAYLPTYTGNVGANWVIADYFSGNAHNLTYLPGANINGAVAYATTANSVAAANVSGLGNIATVNLTGSSSNVLYGNGVFAPVTGGDVQSKIANGTSNVTITPSNGPVVINVNGTEAWTFSDSGNLQTAGDIVGPAGANLTIYANAGVHNFTFGDDGTFYAPDNVVLGGNAIYIGPGANTLTGVEHEVLLASSNNFAYVQGVINNVSDNGSAEWVALGAKGNDAGGWAEVGFTSSGFGDANYTITGAGDGYVFAQSYAPGQTLLGGGGNLILATGNQGSVKDIIFGTGGFLTSNVFGRISDANNALELTRTGSSIKFYDGTELGVIEGANTFGLYNANATEFLLESGATTWSFNGTNGTTGFPTLTVDLHNGGNQSAQTLQFGDPTQQVVITGPTPAVDTAAQRLIIQGQRGNGTGEGGDVYFWAGDADTNGGDIKIYAGDADNVSTGYGGYINLDGGSGFDNGGQVNITGGYSANGQGGTVSVSAGQGGTDGGAININGGSATANQGGNIALQAGYGGNNGGEVRLTGGSAGVGIPGYGNVVLVSGASTWTFDNTGNIVLAGGNSVIQSIANSSLDPTLPNVSTMTLTPDANYTSQVLVLDPTAPGHIHLRAYASSNIDEPSANIFLGGEQTAFEVTSGPNNVAKIHSGNLTWTFSNNSGASVIDLPGESYIRSNQDTVNIQSVDANGIGRGIYIGSNGTLYFWDGNSQSVSLQQDNTNANLTATGNASITSNAYTWTYGTDGNLTLPGNTFAINYANGTQVSLGGTPAGSNNEIQFNSNGSFGASGNYTFTDTVGGGSVEVGNELLLLGNGTISTSSNNLNIQPAGNLVVTSSIYNWNFDTAGNLTLPGNTFAVNYANGSQASAPLVDITNTNGLATTYYPTFVENRTTGQIVRADVDLSYRSDTNTLTVGNITGNTNGYTIGYLNIPQVSASNTTLALTDAGKHYYSTTAGNLTLTVPLNSSVAFPTGTAISIVVQAAGNILVNAASGVSLYLAGNSTAANRVVGTYGMATLMKVASDTWFINGTGVS